MKPNFDVCQSCSYWDDVTGCWKDMKNWEECPYTNEFGFDFEEAAGG